MSAIEPTPTDRITQAELARCRDAGERSRDAIVLHETARKEVLRKLDEGLPVEPGPLRPSVSTREEKRITNAEIVRLMGAEVLEELRAHVRPSVSRSLRIDVVDVPEADDDVADAAAPAYVRRSRAAVHFAVAALALLAGFGPAAAQVPTGREEVVTTGPRLGGVAANAPIPADLHRRNEGSDVDGAGLCVISSLEANGRFQGVPGMEAGKDSPLWTAAKKEPGGYYPEKLERLLKRVMPDEKWFSWEGDGTDLVRAYSAKGFPVATTTNTGPIYGWEPIHHMVSTVHLDDDLAAIVDNNAPGEYRWTTAAEFGRRFPDGGKGWGFVWLRQRAETEYLLFLAAALLAASSVLLLPASLFHLLAARRLLRKP